MITVYKRKEKAAKIRKEGKVPGILYGPNIDSTPIFVLEKELNDFYQKHHAGLFEFEFEEKKFLGLLREVQTHPLTQKLIHFDIYVPALEEEVEAEVPLEYVGEAPAVKIGGVLNFIIDSLKIEALPQNLPEKIVVDISSLKEIGQTIYVKDLKLPPTIKVLVEPITPLVTVVPERSEVEESQVSTETSL